MNNNPADSLEFANDFFFKEVETFLKENMKVLFRVKGGSMRPPAGRGCGQDSSGRF